MEEPVKRVIPEQDLDIIYIAMLDAYERLDNGKADIKRCLNYLEEEHGYSPPDGYMEEEIKTERATCSQFQCYSYSQNIKDCARGYNQNDNDCKNNRAIHY